MSDSQSYAGRVTEAAPRQCYWFEASHACGEEASMAVGTLTGEAMFYCPVHFLGGLLRVAQLLSLGIRP